MREQHLRSSRIPRRAFIRTTDDLLERPQPKNRTQKTRPSLAGFLKSKVLDQINRRPERGGNASRSHPRSARARNGTAALRRKPAQARIIGRRRAASGTGDRTAKQHAAKQTAGDTGSDPSRHRPSRPAWRQQANQRPSGSQGTPSASSSFSFSSDHAKARRRGLDRLKAMSGLLFLVSSVN